MKTILLSAVAIAAMTSVAAAEPRKLADTEMAEVTAGLYDIIFIIPVTVVHSSVNSAAVGVDGGSAASDAESNIAVNNVIDVNQSDFLVGTTLPASAVFAGAGWPWAEPGSGTAGDGVNPLRAWAMITDMLRSRYFGRGW